MSMPLFHMGLRILVLSTGIAVSLLTQAAEPKDSLQQTQIQKPLKVISSKSFLEVSVTDVASRQHLKAHICARNIYDQQLMHSYSPYAEIRIDLQDARGKSVPMTKAGQEDLFPTDPQAAILLHSVQIEYLQPGKFLTWKVPLHRYFSLSTGKYRAKFQVMSLGPTREWTWPNGKRPTVEVEFEIVDLGDSDKTRREISRRLKVIRESYESLKTEN